MMPTAVYAVYGAAGQGRETMPVLREMLARTPGTSAYDLVFIDDFAATKSVNGHRILTYQEFLAADYADKRVNVSIAEPRVRQKLVEQCAADGIGPFSIIAGNSCILDGVTIGAGALIQPFVILTSNIRVGIHFHANIRSSISHDCVIGDYVTFAPGAICNGNVVIEDHVYVGAGALIKNGLPDSPLCVGRGAFVGMGAVVTKDVAPGTTVAGTPARPIVK